MDKKTLNIEQDKRDLKGKRTKILWYITLIFLGQICILSIRLHSFAVFIDLFVPVVLWSIPKVIYKMWRQYIFCEWKFIWNLQSQAQIFHL